MKNVLLILWDVPLCKSSLKKKKKKLSVVVVSSRYVQMYIGTSGIVRYIYQNSILMPRTKTVDHRPTH